MKKIKTWDEKKKKIIRKKMPSSFRKVKLSNSSLRNWLSKHGKDKYIDFNNKERRQYKEIFDALDADGSKAIGVTELEDPLIALGFVANREEVQSLIMMVDEDETGEIEFDEFLLIMRAIKRNENVKEDQSSLYEFFKDMVEGNLNKKEDMDNDIPFMLNFSQYRRKRIMDGIIISEASQEDKEKRIEGIRILNNFKRQMRIRRREEKKEREEVAKKKSILKTLGGAEALNHRTGLLSFEALKDATKKRIEAQFNDN